jgi:DNA-binding LytR/AlgR family response regulator
MKAIIIEDEEIIAGILKEKIREISGDVQVIEILPSLKTARKWFLNNAEPDIIFMDIQLSDGVSFDLFERYTITCPVIFTTAYDEYAVRAFKVNGVDYLLKPIDDEELKKAIDKCRSIINNKSKFPLDIQEFIKSIANPESVSNKYKEKFVVNVRNQWVPINTKDIACFARESLNYVYLFSGERYVYDFSTMEEIEELLNPKQFYRANRQYIINIDAVQMVKPQDNAKLTIHLKEPNHKFSIDMSREKAPTFKKWLDR